MTPKTVLVTGVSDYLGARLVRQLDADPAVERVLGVDVAAPHAEADGMEFVRADIRTPVIGKVIRRYRVDTVVHAPLSAHARLGRSTMWEMNVLGTMRLLAACQDAPRVRRLVVESSTAVYGSSSRDPALFTEAMAPLVAPTAGFGGDASEIEGYVLGFARRRPRVSVTVLRFANVIGARIDSALARYFRGPVVPVPLGHDPRIQLLHEEDAVAVLREATQRELPGVFNVAADGVMLLSQAARRAGSLALPVPSPVLGPLGALLGSIGVADSSSEQVRHQQYGRAVDTTRLRTVFGSSPRWSTAEAFDDYVHQRAVPAQRPATVERAVAGTVVSAARTSP